MFLFRATKMVYGVEPDLTREGGSIPVTLTLQEATGNGQRTYIHTNTHAHANKHIHIHTHIHMHTNKHFQLSGDPR